MRRFPSWRDTTALFERNREMLDVNRKIASGIRVLFLAIEGRKSTFGKSFGGIAQLVERQLCKLEVRGSNPLASKAPECAR